MGFYILLRATDRYAATYNSFPGQFDGEMDEDISRLKTIAVALLGDLGCNGSTLTEDFINEMCRYGAAELHIVAAFVGGIASQEVIKESNHEDPLNGWLCGTKFLQSLHIAFGGSVNHFLKSIDIVDDLS